MNNIMNNQNLSNKILSSFFQFKKKINNQVEKNVVKEHNDYKTKRNSLLNTLVKMRCVIDHIIFLENCGNQYKKYINAHDKMNKLWEELLSLNLQLKDKNIISKLYCIYSSPQRKIKNECLIHSTNNTGNIIKLDISNCYHIFKKSSNPKKEIISISHENYKNIHIDSKTCLQYNEHLIQLEGDTIQVLYLDVFFLRNVNGRLLKKVYKGFNPNDLDELIHLSRGKIQTEKCIQIQNILKLVLSEHLF